MSEDPLNKYKQEALERAEKYLNDEELQSAWRSFHDRLVDLKYAYNFFWLGVPILQEPQDLQAFQELIWNVKPELIIETGIAMGGSLIFSASILSLLEICGKIKNPQVIGIDIEIRNHNKKAIQAHPLSQKIKMIEGSSIDEKIIKKVCEDAKNRRTLVFLDSNHTHEHVLAELKAYCPLVSKNSYCVVGDTGIEELDAINTSERPWGKGNNPMTAIFAFLKENKSFIIDKTYESKILLTGCPNGYLKRIK